MQFNQRWFRDKLNQVATSCIRKVQRPLLQNNDCGYITLFHDFEGSYAWEGKEKVSYHGVTKLLDIEKKYNVKATYNVVGKLFEDYPEIIKRMIDEGHDLASHSYNHKVITDLSKKEIANDIQQSKTVFEKFGLNLQGFRAPQSRWSFALMCAILHNDLKWSAENDKADFPYIILRKGSNTLIRFPIKMDDWDYVDKYISADQFRRKIEMKAKEVETKKSYGAIGFHPWVQGESEDRLNTYEEFLERITNIPTLKIVTFEKMYSVVKKSAKRRL